MTTVRSLLPKDDPDEIGRLYAESWQEIYRGILPQGYLNKLTHDRWSAMLRADPASTLAVFASNGRPLGAATVCFSREMGREGYGEIVSIYLRPGCNGRGYGRLLMEAALGKLRADGCENVCLWTFSRNTRAEGFYLHMGFAATGAKQTEVFGGEPAELREFARSLL